MPGIHEIDLGGRLMCLFKGESGTGKTVAACSFPGPIHIMDFDGRLKPIKLMFPNRRDISYERYGPRRISPRNGQPEVRSMEMFYEDFERLVDNCTYGTLIIDSFTSFTITAVTSQLLARSSSKEAKDKPTMSKGGIMIPDFDEYKGETSIVTTALDISKVLPCHVVWTAHPVSKIEVQGSGAGIQGVKKSRPITGYGTKAASIVPGYFDEVWHFEAKRTVAGAAPSRLIHTQSLGDDFAKTALPLPPVIDITNRAAFKVVMEYLDKHHIEVLNAAQKEVITVPEEAHQIAEE